MWKLKDEMGLLPLFVEAVLTKARRHCGALCVEVERGGVKVQYAIGWYLRFKLVGWKSDVW
jgi:hypothetical protein